MKGREIDWKDRVLQITDGDNHHIQELADKLVSKPKVKVEITEYDILGSEAWCRGVAVRVNGQDLGKDLSNPITMVEAILKHLGYDVEINNEYDI